MGLDLNNDQKRDIILAAYNSAGAGADDQAVAGQIGRILAAFEEGSAAMRAFERAEKRAAQTTGHGTFRAVPIYVDFETSSKRYVIFLKTEVSGNAPEGIEIIRTDRQDSAEGPLARTIANTVLELLGQTALISKAIETSADGQSKVRLIRGIEGQGPAEGFQSGFTLQQGAAMIDWQSGGKGAFPKIAGKLERLASMFAQTQAQQPAQGYAQQAPQGYAPQGQYAGV